LSDTVTGYVPAVLLPDVKDPETCPSDDTAQYGDVQVPSEEKLTVHAVAADEKPYPVNENCVPTVPDAGVTVITGIIERLAGPTGSFTGEPTTLIAHGFLSAVAKLLTTKLPVAVPVELMLHVGEERIIVLGVACKLQPVSDVLSPTAVKVTVVRGVTEPLG